MSSDTSSPTSTQPADESARDWFAKVPDDWAGFVSFRSAAVASPDSRNALRDHMARHLQEGEHALELGLGLMAAGEPARALPHLRAAKGDLAALLAASAAASAGDASAEKLIAGLTRSAKVGARAALELAEIHARRRDTAALAKDLAALTAAGGSAADRAFLEGLAAEAEGRHEDALKHWQAALASDAAHVETIFRLSELLARLGDDDAALALLDPFRTGVLPAHVGALINLGILYEDQERHDFAQVCFRMVVLSDPTNARARRYLADAGASLDQYYDETRDRRADKQSAVLRIPVTDFELSVRARNCLQKMHIHTLGDLVSRTEADLLAFKNFGETSLQEVKDILQNKNLRLGMLPSSFAPLTPMEAVASAHDGDVHEILISELDLSVRSRAALATLGITKVAELAATTETTLLSCKNFGQTSLDEITSKLRQLGLELAG